MMESIVPQCTNLKHQYDKCFYEWFSEHYIKGDRKISPACEDLFKKYKDCIRPYIKEELKANRELELD